MSNKRMTDKQLLAKYGRRNLPESAVILDEPSELGYRCPKGHHMSQITWSEYNNHIWCYVCKQDYHYAADCRLMRPCSFKPDEWEKLISQLPQRPRILSGIMHYPDCTLPHPKKLTQIVVEEM